MSKLKNMKFTEVIQNHLRCVDCKGELFFNSDNSLLCKKCGRIYSFQEVIIKMLPSEMLSRISRANVDKISEIKMKDDQAINYDKKVAGLYANLLEKLTLNYLDIPTEDKSKKILLDLGCGTGRFEHLLHDKYQMIFAVDFSLESLKIIAGKNYPNVLLIQADVNYLPFDEEIFDDVCMVDFFQHIPTFCLREKLLSCVNNISKKGAKIILTSYNYNKQKQRQKLIYPKSEKVIGEKGKIGYHAQSIYYYNYHYSELVPLVSQFFEVKNYFGFFLDFPLCIKIIRQLLSFIKMDLVKFEARYYFTGNDLKWGNRLFVFAVKK